MISEKALNAAVEVYAGFPEQGDMRQCIRMILESYEAARAIKPEAVSQGRITPELDNVETILRDIAKRPNLPNPERDADWRNCMKWSSHDAAIALNLIPAIRAQLQRDTVPVAGSLDWTNEEIEEVAETFGFNPWDLNQGIKYLKEKRAYLARVTKQEVGE